MKRSPILGLLLFIFLFFGCSTLLYENHSAAVRECQCLPVFPDKDGWYGGDGAYSIQFDAERTLWLFGDTFVAEEAGRKDRIGMDVVLGTTLAISTCSDDCEFGIRYYLKKQTQKLVSSFGEDEWLWPQDPFMVGGVLYIPLMAVAPTDRAGGIFNFKINGHKLARISDFSAEDPHDWPVDYIDWTPAIPPEITAFATSSVVHEDYIYFYPLYSYSSDKLTVLGNILARMPVGREDHPVGAVEYYTHDGTWQTTPNPSTVKIVLDAGVSELSVRYHAADQKWIAVYLSLEDKGGHLLYRSADQLQGPWCKPKPLIVNIPEVDPQNPLYDKNTFCYAGKEHIEFAGHGNLVVTYICNSAEDEAVDAGFISRHLFLYRPVVVQVPCCE